MPWDCPGVLKSKSGMMRSSTDGNLRDLCLGASSLLVQETFKFKVLKRDFQLPKIIGM